MSLKDQMVKAGLVSAKQARQAAHAERVERKTSGGEESERAARARAEEARREQEAARQRDRALSLDRQGKQAEQEHAAQERDRHQAAVAAALRDGKVEHWSGNRAYYFSDGTRIERLDVSDDTQRRLQEGRVAIVRTGEPQTPYTLLHAAQALRLGEVEPNRIVTLHGA
jgi:uncharacterized protein YaiL (DUF2058 family)